MREWFRPRTKESVSEPGPAAISVSQKQPETQRSLAFNVLYHQFRAGKKYRILDLGPAFGQNVDFFAQFRCRLHIEDLYESLSSFDYFSPEDGFSYEAVYAYLLPFFRNAPFDLILTWDLLNYLDRDEFKFLIHHLSHYSTNGTLLFALISTEKHIPERPNQFKIVDEEHLLYIPTSQVLRPCPQWEQSDFDQLMPNFRVCNSFLLRNGFREYLFLYE